jgi:tRNA(Ile)-lysidine synthase TilS/MesJ
MFFGFLLFPLSGLIPVIFISLTIVSATRYAYFKKLDYFSTECIYSPDAYRGHARAFLKDLEAARPSAIIDIIHSGEAFEIKEEIKATQKVQRKYTLNLPAAQRTSILIVYSTRSFIYRNLQTMWIHVQQ